MSKRAIKTAEKNADLHGYLCGLASYEYNVINVERHEDALYANIRALELLEILDWDSAHELLSPIFDKAKQQAYSERQVLEELKAK